MLVSHSLFAQFKTCDQIQWEREMEFLKLYQVSDIIMIDTYDVYLFLFRDPMHDARCSISPLSHPCVILLIVFQLVKKYA